MLNQNPLISLEGTKYLFSLLLKGISKTDLMSLFDSLFEKDITKRKECYDGSIKEKRKQNQINGLLKLIEGNKRRIFEIGCGNGLLTYNIAKRYSELDVVGLDNNPALIEKCRQKFKETKNLIFITEDAHALKIDNSGLVISLHGCGDLSDRVIDIAEQSKSDVIIAPCCYSKIKRKVLDYTHQLPRSKELQSFREDFIKKVLINTSKYENQLGRFRDKSESRLDEVHKEIYRLIVNIDRLIYLKEKGYQVEIKAITSKYFEDEKGMHKNSPMRYALIGKVTR